MTAHHPPPTADRRPPTGGGWMRLGTRLQVHSKNVLSESVGSTFVAAVTTLVVAKSVVVAPSASQALRSEAAHFGPISGGVWRA